MTEKKKIINLKKFKRKGNWNIGLILFGVIFFYLIITVLTYLTKDRISSYEVREGSILKDTAFTGIALREEKVVRAEESGYINYFSEAGQKLAVNGRAYVISREKLSETDTKEKNDEVSLSAEDWNSILLRTQNFNENFRTQDFKTAKILREETTALLQSNTNQSKVMQLNTLIEGGNSNVSVYNTPDDGIVEYTIDGYETMSAGKVTDEQLARKGYSQTEMMNNVKVSAGDPIYRLITDEEWTLVIKLTKELEDVFRERMGERTSLAVKVRFAKDNESMWGTMQIFNRGKDDAYGSISFSEGMIRYAKERFLDVELILEDQSGLKIPKSSVTKKEFYVVSEEYLTSGGASKAQGVYRQRVTKKGNAVTEFQPATVFYRNTETGVVYLDPDEFEEGDILVKPESSDTTRLDKRDFLKGVYNINKGYAVFKQIHILCESEEYYIVEEGNRYGLSNYDHIALDGSSVRENDVVSQ